MYSPPEPTDPYFREYLDAKIAEYTSLRSSVESRVRLRHQIVVLSMTAFAGVVAAAGAKLPGAYLLLLAYPAFACQFAIRWNHVDSRIVLMGYHLHENIEKALPEGYLNWYPEVFPEDTDEGERPFDRSTYYLFHLQAYASFAIGCVTAYPAMLTPSGKLGPGAVWIGAAIGIGAASLVTCHLIVQCNRKATIKEHNKRFSQKSASG